MTTLAPNPTHPTFIKQLNLIGIGVLVASLVYFVASNWFYLPHSVRMAIPMSLMVLSSVASIWIRHDTARQTLHTLVVAMIGLSLAVIGQAYQTGADSFWLFGIWSVLALPYLYRHNYGVFFIWAIISPLTAYLFTQTHIGTDSLFYLLVMNILLLGNLYLAHRYYPIGKYLLVFMIGALSLFSVFLQLDNTHIIYILSIIALPLFAIYLFKKHQESISTALMTSLFGLSLLSWALFEIFDIHNLSFFAIGTLSFLWFCGIGIYLNSILPKGKFHSIPIGIGAYLAGIFYALSFLTFWETGSLFFGLITTIISFITLKKLNSNTDNEPTKLPYLFIRHLAYALMLCGQVAFLYHLDDKIEMTFPLIIAQLIFASIAIFIRVHWLVIIMQLLGVYGLTYAYIQEFVINESPILYYLSISDMVLGVEWLMLLVLLLIQKNQSSLPHRAIWGFVICVVITTVFLTNTMTFYDDTTTQTTSLVIYGLQFSLIATLIYQFFNHHLTHIGLLLLIVLSGVLIGFGQFGLAISMLGVCYGVSRPDKFINYIYIIGVIGLLWYGYYHLSATFLTKSMVMAISGVAILLLAWLLTLPKLQRNSITYDK
ncbi:Uncharacterized membrane-anchored protein [Moraxella lacunata]|uniref:Uncharacterized membrane-anchored protein n=1 Tax=Moraxella lacunata TaxID=477 RepID=A0A378T6F5_MORLA|nr:DUF2157 domain-containing protein [Moraxella lacunata]STZ55737.1 Uncharacterized membrane-anchored protein [Moraxella lacunata]